MPVQGLESKANSAYKEAQTPDSTVVASVVLFFCG